jgi:hypothetical protein
MRFTSAGEIALPHSGTQMVANLTLKIFELPTRIACLGATAFWTRDTVSKVQTISGEVHSAAAIVFCPHAAFGTDKIFRWFFLCHE